MVFGGALAGIDKWLMCLSTDAAVFREFGLVVEDDLGLLHMQVALLQGLSLLSTHNI